ncbi:formyltetrahydrofolate deformylase [Candidatus Pantoea formicae]|uniref:formyltetrahydrofolate deformylase n=1 Tax=Candidatus Pantoea formicae TaxID=2608355 RepID=UPI003ED8B3F9|nr:formyltetrahydrofolate deformylase [Erwiniaceae bacterium L1_54_3]
MSRHHANWILTAQCPSKLGSVDVVTRFLKEQRCYINEQHSFDDKCAKRFFIRTVFEPQTESFDPVAFRDEFSLRAADFAMSYELTEPDYKVPVVIMVSKTDHCLNDLLYRHRAGKLAIDIKAVISNHPLLEPIVAWHGLPYHYFPVTAATREEQERQIWQVVQETGAELVVLARYMQVMSAEMCQKLAGRAINIHHSLLPGFKGAKPYHQAYDKGVKLVGATAHFINEDLDEGPIISQKVEVVSHSDYADDLVDKGRDIERLTLAHAVSCYAERRVFLYENRTVVFSR